MKLFQKNESKETVKLPMSGKVKNLPLPAAHGAA